MDRFVAAVGVRQVNKLEVGHTSEPVSLRQFRYHLHTL
jgi:hypothetical protein